MIPIGREGVNLISGRPEGGSFTERMIERARVRGGPIKVLPLDFLMEDNSTVKGSSFDGCDGAHEEMYGEIERFLREYSR